ncbi:MAG TPA: hypothetical protein DD490_20295 [Acidobacteria bacterium]|nr:hypothetical protein [Acidobacteriota bacterium]
MFRMTLRRGIPVLIVTLLLAAAAPAAASSPAPGLWEGVRDWLVSFLTSDRGLGADPNEATTNRDRGAGLDPNGGTTPPGTGADPNG